MLVLSLGATAGTGWYFYQYQHEYLADTTIVMQRNFFGMLRVQESGEGNDRKRSLVHGVIMHGMQSFDPQYQKKATTYYTEDSGVGRVFTALADSSLRTGVIGLGVGTLAAYGRKGDVMRFYDINPQVIELARKEFTFLSDSAAKIETVLGDARLAMEREAVQQYDILVVDAFSSDAIPVHLLTKEAVTMYVRKLTPSGILAFHISNRYLDLEPVLVGIAREIGLVSYIQEDGPDDEEKLQGKTQSKWMVLARKKADLKGLMGRINPWDETQVEAVPKTWTDDFSNVLGAFKGNEY